METVLGWGRRCAGILWVLSAAAGGQILASTSMVHLGEPEEGGGGAPRTLRVPLEYPTIQAAVDAAASGDTVLVAPGTYTGAGNRDIQLLNREGLTIRSEGGAAATILDAQGSATSLRRHFRITGDGVRSCVIQGFTMRNGFSAEGGSIYMNVLRSATLTVQDCVFQSNRANHAANQDALTYGGALYLRTGVLAEDTGYPLIRRNRFLSNTATSNYAGWLSGVGGAISVDTPYCWPMISDNEFESNRAYLAGGAVYASTPVRMHRNVFRFNTADIYGGGAAYVWMDRWLTIGTAFDKCVFIGNAALTPLDPTAPRRGGALYISYGLVDVNGCTFYGNDAIAGEALYWYASQTEVTNSVFWGSQTQPQIVAEAPVGNEYFHVTYCDVKGGYPGVGNLNADPRFVDAASRNLRLAAGSPCIDAGNGTRWPLELDPDVEGKLRSDDPDVPNTGAGRVPYADLGAYEHLGRPQPPTGLSGTAGAGSVSLRWLPNAAGEYVVGYRIFRAAASGGPYVLVGEVAGATYQLTDPVPSSGTWFYRISAVNLAGESAPSGSVSVPVGTASSGPTGISLEGIEE